MQTNALFMQLKSHSLTSVLISSPSLSQERLLLDLVKYVLEVSLVQPAGVSVISFCHLPLRKKVIIDAGGFDAISLVAGSDILPFCDFNSTFDNPPSRTWGNIGNSSGMSKREINPLKIHFLK